MPTFPNTECAQQLWGLWPGLLRILDEELFQGILAKKKGGVASSAGKRGTSIEDNKLNLIQSMEIFDYTKCNLLCKVALSNKWKSLGKHGW